jgi:LAS superfamily LD-carboxypeptidase LdcB
MIIVLVRVRYDKRMNTEKKRFRIGFWLLLVVLIGVGAYITWSLQQKQVEYDQKAATLETQSKIKPPTLKLDGSDKPVYLITPDLLAQGNNWGLVSRDHPLQPNFTPRDLVSTSVAHGDKGTDMQVQRHIESPLRALFAAGESEGVELMLSSAYRSIADQQNLYDEYVAEQGVAAAKTYVATPGSSEHHTGLAVDFATASDECQADSDDCSLSQADAAWLLENGPKFGFILRYPQGKKDITGVGFEPWHYRYVGVALAREMAKTDLTLDQAIEQLTADLKQR